jgi:hypothetical protein
VRISLEKLALWSQVLATALQVFATAFLALSVWYAACQLHDTHEVFMATTIYNLDKDWRQVFEKTKSSEFTKCFAAAKEETTFPSVAVCLDPGARATFLDVLDYYGLLFSLRDHGGLSDRDVRERLSSGCTYLTSRGGKATLKSLTDSGQIRLTLIQRIEPICGKPQ